MKRKFFITSGVIAVLFGAAQAQEQQNFANYKPDVKAEKITTAEAPKIDGKLDDAIWQRITPAEKFYEVYPIEGKDPSEKTAAYFAYDENTLYVAVYNYDKEPEKILVSTLRRDPDLGDEDGIRLILDPFQTGRDSYYFGMNAAGAKLDALTEGNSNYRDQWDTIWDGAASKTDQGWVAEFAIPFRSIAFDPERDQWGVQLVRNIPRKNEAIRWSNIDRSVRRIDVSNIGTLSGIEGAKPGGQVEAQVFATTTASRVWEDQTHQGHDDELSFNPSGNLFYKFTPSLTGTLTVNTDFSDSGLDSRQVNTGRFSLFFPETREFFLQDSASFAFGGRNFTNWNPNSLPFFSRRIGIVEGVPTDIIAGGKISGQHAGFDIGGLVTITDDVDVDGTEYEGQALGALRVSRNISDDIKVGMLVTSGDPTGLEDALTYGVDFQYNNGDFLNGRFVSDTALTFTDNDGGSGSSMSSFNAYRSNTWNATLRARYVSEEYDPKLGFTSRPDIIVVNANGWRHFNINGDVLQRINIGGWGTYVESHSDNKFQDNEMGNFTDFIFANGDEIDLGFGMGRERIDTAYDLAGILHVPAKSYDKKWADFEFSRAQHHALSWSASYNYSEILDGTRHTLAGRVKYRPNPRFSIQGRLRRQAYDLPSGELDIYVASIDNEINITPNLNFETEVQYDNISENMAWLTQMRWQYKPETEIFTSFGHTADMDENDFPYDFTSTSTALSFRIGHRFRF